MIYDTIIIGTGPAGLTASIYTSRYFLKTLAIGQSLGGSMATAHKIENYPGVDTISGLELAKKMSAQAETFGVTVKSEEVVDIKKGEKGDFEIYTDAIPENDPYIGKTVILATGTQRRVLGVPGERELLGRGVSYCATCDAGFFKDKTVAVVGGANSATMAAAHLADYARKIYVVYRGDKLRGEGVWNRRVLENHKTDVLYNTNVTKITGESKVEKIILDKEFNDRKELTVDGVFIEIGATPVVNMVSKLGLEFDEAEFIKVDTEAKTTVPGVFAAGDATSASNKFWQIATAIGEGAVAAKSAYDYIANKKNA